jgi:rhamnosyltransferase
MQFWGTYRGYRQSGPLTWQLRKTFYYPLEPLDQTIPNQRKVEPIQYNQ